MRLRFDRGTILFDGLPGTAELPQLPGLLWDSRVSKWRAPARLQGEIRAQLERSGIAFVDEIRHPGRIPSPWAPIELRSYQRAAVDAWHHARGRGLVVLPTGAGKTRVAMVAMAESGLATLCLVPTRALVHQWREELAKFYFGKVGIYGDGEHELEAITVATFESGYRYMDRLGNHFDLLVLDEVHHFGVGARDELLDMSIAPYRLGLTATPPRDISKLNVLVGPTIYERRLGDLAGRYLASYDVVTLRLSLTPEERKDYERAIGRFRELQAEYPHLEWQAMVKLAVATERGREGLAAFRRARSLLAFPQSKARSVATLLDRHREARTLIFTADNETAYAIARQHLIMPLTCDIGRREREEVLSRFRAGELRALVSARVLNEGIDVPDADVAIVVGGTMGEREHVQRVGRLLRPTAGKRAIVYELVTTGTIEVGQARRRGESLVPGTIARL